MFRVSSSSSMMSHLLFLFVIVALHLQGAWCQYSCTVPSGTYLQTCVTCMCTTGLYQNQQQLGCFCQRSDYPSQRSYSELDLLTCSQPYNIYNNNGQLACSSLPSPTGSGGGGGSSSASSKTGTLYFELAWLVLWIILTALMSSLVILNSTFRVRKRFPERCHHLIVLAVQFVCWVLSLAAMSTDDWAVDGQSSSKEHFGLVASRQGSQRFPYSNNWNGGGGSNSVFVNTPIVAAYSTLLFGVVTVVSASIALIVALLPFLLASCQRKENRYKQEKAQRLWQSAIHIQALTALAAVLIWSVSFYRQMIDFVGGSSSSFFLGPSWALFLVMLIGSFVVLLLPTPFPSLHTNQRNEVDSSMSNLQVSGMYVAPPAYEAPAASVPPPYDMLQPPAVGYSNIGNNHNTGYVSLNATYASAPPLIVNSNIQGSRRADNAFCTGCGASLAAMGLDYTFCGNCGKPIPQ